MNVKGFGASASRIWYSVAIPTTLGGMAPLLVLAATDRHPDVTGTWLDAFNFLDLIAGPPFLGLFALHAVITLVVLWWAKTRLLESLEPVGLLDPNGRVPFRYKPSYLELAYLKGGRKAVVEAALCNLYRLRIINAALMQSKMMGATPGTVQLHPVERAVAHACFEQVSGHRIASDHGVRAALDRFIPPARQKLRLLGFLPLGSTYAISVLFTVLALLLIDGLGYVRLQRSLMRGYHNVGFLVMVMLLAALPALLLAYTRCSGAGTRYLRSLRGEYRSLIRRVQAHSDFCEGPELLYAIAACGAAALGGTGYAALHDRMQPPRTTSDSCSSCGGGGCGGGGCGGGGCGGGGCGGG